MARKSIKSINRKKRLVLLVLFVFLISVPVALEMRMRHEQEKKWELLLGSYEGHFRVEAVSGSLKRNVGEMVVVERKGGELSFRPELDQFDYKFSRLKLDEFEIRPTNIKMIYLRDSSGKIIGISSKPDPRNFKFILRKVE